MFVRYFLFLLCALAITKTSLAVPKMFANITYSRNFFASDKMDSEEHSTDSSEFHEKKAEKIYGGAYAVLGQFPFMAIVHQLSDEGTYFVCGGTILSKRWVLTAAHCVEEKPQKFLVAFGVVDKSKFGYDYIGKQGVSMITNQGAIYPGYILGQHDIALLYMPNDIPFNHNIQPIRLAGASYTQKSYIGQIGHVYGWGKADQEGRAITKLKYGAVPIISYYQCRSTWNIDGTHICTDASTNNDVCQGDSGGPLIVFESDDEPVQVGIVSYGDTDCPSSKPTVFTRVSAYHAWIKQVTGISYK